MFNLKFLSLHNCNFVFVTLFTLMGTLSGLTACAQESPVKGNFDFENWNAYLGGADSSQYSSLKQINKNNVTQLEVAWTYNTGEHGKYRFNPLIVNGVMYVLAHDSAIVALNAGTGAEIWRHETDGRVGARGFNYWQNSDASDQRLLFVNAGSLTTLNANTGTVVSSFGENGRVDLRLGLEGNISNVRELQTDNPGRIFEDLIIMSLPAGGGGYTSTPADIHAYNIISGELQWVFHVVPNKDEFGAETWPEDDNIAFGGVHNWSESTVDSELGIVFIPTGTARYDFYGGNRHGDNLFGNSLLALNAKTGERLWHFQTIHHDLWDYDLASAPKLLTVNHDGKDILAVAQATKQGFLFVFNRQTGEPLWPIEERPVPQSDAPGEQTSPTQPFPTLPPPFARISFTEEDINPFMSQADQDKTRDILRSSRNEGLFTPPSTQKSTIMMPGTSGGANWGSSAVDPLKGLMFIVSKELPSLLDKMRIPEKERLEDSYPNVNPDFLPYNVSYDYFLQPNGLSAISPPWSQVTAYDLNKGTILWQVPNGEVEPLLGYGFAENGSHNPRGGPVVTDGGLIFIGTSSDRKFRARDVDDGSVLWEYDLTAASEGVPAVYAIDGQQYIAIAVGGNGDFENGLFDQVYYLSEPGPGQYIVFALPH